MTGDITEYLKDWKGGASENLNQAVALAYDELKKAARYHLQNEAGARTLQPTALVNEVYLRLANSRQLTFENRHQFLWFAGRMMRRIIVDHARAKLADKRRGEHCDIPLEIISLTPGPQNLEMETLIALDTALSKLEKMDERQARIVEMRFFVGVDLESIAKTLNISLSTVKREWNIVKLWLARELKSNA